jgi:hypothetical protein
METQSQPEYVDTSAQQPLAAEVNRGQTLALPPVNKSSEQWQQIGEQVSVFLAKLPDYIGWFFNEYKQPILSVAFILTALITVKVVLAVLDAIDDVPLLSPTFQLIGIIYSGWFVYRYLLKAENRQELAQEIEAIKQQVTGNNRLPRA